MPTRVKPDFGFRIMSGTITDRVLAVRFPELARRVAEADQAGQLTDRLSIGFVGLRWKSLDKLAWPAYGRIGWDGSQARYRYEMSPQRWGYKEGKFVTGATGHSQTVAQRFLRERFSGADLPSKEDSAAAMIDILRSLPPQDPTVGRDCLVTTIQAVPPHARIKYEPFGSTQMLVESASGQTMTLESAVSPWIITPDRLLAPLAMNVPEIPFSSSGFDFRIEGLESTGDLSIVSSQPRRLWLRDTAYVEASDARRIGSLLHDRASLTSCRCPSYPRSRGNAAIRRQGAQESAGGQPPMGAWALQAVAPLLRSLRGHTRTVVRRAATSACSQT